MKRVPIERLSPDSPEILDRVRRSLPFITRVTWPAHERWTPAYLKQQCRPKKVTLYRIGNPVAIAEEADIGDYIELFSDPSWAERYEPNAIPQTRLWFKGEPDPSLGALLSDISYPSIVNRDKLQSVNLWLMSGAFDNSLHFDPNGLDNLNAQITGRKRWRLLSPRYGGVVRVEANLSNIGAPMAAAEGFMPSDWEDDSRYADVECLEGVTEPGDAIFVPAFWFHWVTHLAPVNLNVNFWWEPDHVKLDSVPVGWAFNNALITVFRRRYPDASLVEACEAIAKLPQETLELLLQIEQTLLWDPRVLSGVSAMALRTEPTGAVVGADHYQIGRDKRS